MLDQREAPIVGVKDQPREETRPSHIAAFNVGGLNLSPASNDAQFDLGIEEAPEASSPPDAFNEGGAGNKTADQKATEFTEDMGMQADIKIGNGGGSLGQLSQKELLEKKEERAGEYLEMMLEVAERHEKEIKAAQAKWDSEMHDYGGEKLSGAEIMERIDWFSKKENQDKVREALRKQGKTEQEVEDTIKKMKERDELLKRQRNNEKLSPEEQLRLDTLNKDGYVVGGTKAQEASIKEDKGLSKDSAKLDAKAATFKDLSTLQEKEITGRITAAELEKLNQIKADPTAQSIKSLIVNGSPKVVEAVTASGAPPTTIARETFPTAALMKQEFTAAATATAIGPVPTPKLESLMASEPKAAQGTEPPKITTAKVEAVANAFM